MPTTFQLEIPQSSGAPLIITVGLGEPLYVLGPNGAGKSALMHRFYRHHAPNSRRISAHRQTWFGSDVLDISAAAAFNIENSFRDSDRGSPARWMEYNAAQRPVVTIHNLIEAENTRARSIANAVDAEDLAKAIDEAKLKSPITTINELLEQANIPISISIAPNSQAMASKGGSPAFSIAHLSDGERSALLLAAAVLSAPPGVLLVIDEPERHLHRSISSPLLLTLFEKRRDCAFVVSTHEPALPADSPSSRTVLIRGTHFENGDFLSWEVDQLGPGENVDENLKRAILGSRRKVIFVEGEEGSLDKLLYNIMFKEASIVPKGSCTEVERAVAGMRSVEGMHDIRAFGIIDNDGKGQSIVDALRKKSIYALPMFSVESIYYDPEVLEFVVGRRVKAMGEDAAKLVAAGTSAAIDVIKPRADYLIMRRVEYTIRDRIMDQIPERRQIEGKKIVSITIDADDVISAERSRMRAALESGDLTSIVKRYPLRDSGALDALCRGARFVDRRQYESAVRQAVADDPEFRERVKAKLEPFATDFAATT